MSGTRLGTQTTPGASRHDGRHPMDLTRIRDLLQHDGPFTTVHAEVGRASEDAVQQLEARSRNIRQQLGSAGVDQRVVDEMVDRVSEQTHLPGEVRRTLVASASKVLFDDAQSGHSYWPETVDHGPLPDLAGWLTIADRAVPFVLVVTDRTGADIEAHRALASAGVDRRTVTGADFDIRKVSAGAWAQDHYQQSAEDTWQDNARKVADGVRSLVKSHPARAVFVAGEERARSELVTALDVESALGDSVPLVQIQSGGRAQGASDEAMWDEIRAEVARLEAGADEELANRLEEARGRGEGGASGLEQVLQALAQARVDRLVLDLDVLHEREVRPSDHPGLALPAGVDRSRSVPADRVLVAAAALSGADLSLLPAELSRGGGAAALLRWT